MFTWMAKNWKGSKLLNFQVSILMKTLLENTMSTIVRKTFAINTSKHIMNEKHLYYTRNTLV